MSNKLTLPNRKEFGIEETKAKEIAGIFKPMLDKMVSLEERANEVFSQPRSPERILAATTLLSEYVKVRTGTAKIHKEQKSFYLKAGRFIDGWKNAQILASEGVEKRLKEIKDEVRLAARAANVAVGLQRIEQADEANIPRERIPSMWSDEETLGAVPDQVWNPFLESLITAIKLEKEETIRLEKEEADRVKLRKRISLVREQLAPYLSYLDGTTIDLSIITDAEVNILIEHGKNKKQEVENEIKLSRLHVERQLALTPYWDFVPKEYQLGSLGSKDHDKFEAMLLDVKNKKEQAEAKTKRDAQEAKKKADDIQAALDKKVAEERADAQAEQDLLHARDGVKITALKKDLNDLMFKYQFKSNKNRAVFAVVTSKLKESIELFTQNKST